MKYIIHRFDIVFYLKKIKLLFSFTHTHINQVGPFVFHNIYEIATVWIPLKTENENKKHYFLANQTASKYQTGDWHLPSIWNKVLKLNAFAPNNINAFAKEFYQYI